MSKIWLIQLKTGSRVVSSGCESKRVVQIELKDALETASADGEVDLQEKRTMDLARKGVCFRISHCRAQSLCAGDDGLMMVLFSEAVQPRTVRLAASRRTDHSQSFRHRRYILMVGQSSQSFEVQSVAGRVCRPSPSTLRDWGLWIWLALLHWRGVDEPGCQCSVTLVSFSFETLWRPLCQLLRPAAVLPDAAAPRADFCGSSNSRAA